MPGFKEMSEIERLREFRTVLVLKRRSLIAQVLDFREKNASRDPAAGSATGKDVRDLQEQIEAVDRAIADEERAASFKA